MKCKHVANDAAPLGADQAVFLIGASELLMMEDHHSSVG